MSGDLQKCETDNAHYFVNSLQACPWCEIESHSGIVLFQSDSGNEIASRFDMVKTWTEILSIPAPGHDAVPNKSSDVTNSMIKQGRAIIRRQRYSGVGSVFLVFIAFGFLQFLPFNSFLVIFLSIVMLRTVNEFINTANSAAEEQLKQLKILAELHLSASKKLCKVNYSSEAFSKALRELTTKKKRYEKLPYLRYQKIDELQKAVREHQLHDFLSAHQVEDADLPGIGPAEILALEACGIENAENVSKLSSHTVPGLKSSQVNTLEKWCRSLRDEFRDQPKLGLSLTDLTSIEAEISTAKIKLQKELRSGPAYLKQLSQQIQPSNDDEHPSVQDCLDAYLQVRRYLEEFSPKFWIRLIAGVYVFNLIIYIVRSI